MIYNYLNATIFKEIYLFIFYIINNILLIVFLAKFRDIFRIRFNKKIFKVFKILTNF
jgi:hypothetical protein